MEKKYEPLKTLLSTTIMTIMATSIAHSAGFSLYGEGNGAAIGNYGAGIAAEATDASIGWYNPAGLVLIRDQQVVSGGVGVFPNMKLSGISSFSTELLPTYTQSFTNLETSTPAFVPSFHYAQPCGEKITFGLSVVSPFGLATDWALDSPIRYQATFSELITVNVSPELGGRLTDHVSVGAGVDLQYARVKFNRVLGVPTLFPTDPTINDSLSYNKGSSYGVGFHAGLLALFNKDHTRIGLNYQSKINHRFHGVSRLTGNLASNDFIIPSVAAGAFVSHDLYSNEISLPDIVTLSAYHDLNEKIALLSSVVYTGWNVFNTIQLNNVAAPGIDPDSLDVTQILLNAVSPQNYKNVWRFSLGANYYLNRQLMLRVGGGFDQTPTNDTDRDVRLPDTNRYALSMGAHYQMRPNIGVDFGYTHLFGDRGQINRRDQLGVGSAYNVTATSSATAELVGAQVVWAIDKLPEAPMK